MFRFPLLLELAGALDPFAIGLIHGSPSLASFSNIRRPAGFRIYPRSGAVCFSNNSLLVQREQHRSTGVAIWVQFIESESDNQL